MPYQKQCSESESKGRFKLGRGSFIVHSSVDLKFLDSISFENPNFVTREGWTRLSPSTPNLLPLIVMWCYELLMSITPILLGTVPASPSPW